MSNAGNNSFTLINHWYVCLFVFYFICFLHFFRLSNNEKKLEAVRSGVRAISVSGKIKTPKQTVWFRFDLIPVRLSVCPPSVFSSQMFFLLLISHLFSVETALLLSFSSVSVCLLPHSSSPSLPLHHHHTPYARCHPFTEFSSLTPWSFCFCRLLIG